MNLSPLFTFMPLVEQFYSHPIIYLLVHGCLSTYKLATPWRKGWPSDQKIPVLPRAAFTACRPSNGMEVKDVFGHPAIRVRVVMSCKVS